MRAPPHRLALALALAACGGSQATSTAPDGSATFATNDADAPLPRNETDAPEISRSAGEEGGVVLLWPRVVPRDARDDLRAPAASVQERLRALVQQAAPTRVIDERPEPERVCPRSGCRAPAVGALLVRSGQGCAAFLLVSAAGTSPTGVVPWIGEATVRNSMVPFRDPPEAQVAITDFTPCAAFGEHLADREPELLERLREELP
jgi:hypothetical protein